MKFNRILAAGFLGAAMLFASTADACTNFLFTKGATKDGSTMITYTTGTGLSFTGEAEYTRAGYETPVGNLRLSLSMTYAF